MILRYQDTIAMCAPMQRLNGIAKEMGVDTEEKQKFIVADSGARESFDTGMVRDSREGKGRFDLITPAALRRLALVYEGGAVKYAARNWEKGSPLSRFADSAQRHLNDYHMVALYKRDGIPLERLPADVNPNEDHLAQAAWNLFCIMHHEELHSEFDDLSVKK